MVHRNAPLTETGRLRLARCVVDDEWPVRRAAERFQVAHTTASRWARRYREAGAAGMADRSSRPHASPRRTPWRHMYNHHRGHTALKGQPPASQPCHQPVRAVHPAPAGSPGHPAVVTDGSPGAARLGPGV